MTIIAGALLVDPPWYWKARSAAGDGRSANQHYAVMSLDDLKAYPVREMAAPDSWLFLWVVSSMLPDGLEVMSAWGFEYSSTAFVWVKQNKAGDRFITGMGMTTRKGAEICLLGKRGHPRIRAHDVRELIVAPRREHSRKPDEQYERIERLVDGPYLELFARNRRPGWISLDDEIKKFTEFSADATTAAKDAQGRPLITVAGVIKSCCRSWNIRNRRRCRKRA
jgi:N6-adenosine-specific RNA methylase IME4